MLGGIGADLIRRLLIPSRSKGQENTSGMIDILNLALPYFGLIFVGFACGKIRSLPESGLTWMNFFLL
jgi:hypothetical protein